MIKTWQCATLLLAVVSIFGCFSMIHDPARRFYVLHVDAQPPMPGTQAPIDALIRVRDLDCESAYDKFQMVVRRSPYELSYRQKDVWAVKPGRMISDLLARALQQQGPYAGVTRELGERRPDYLLSGELHVLEIEQHTSTWQAHVVFSLQMTDVDTGDMLWSGQFDEHEPCESHDYLSAVEATSRAVSRAIQKALLSFTNVRHAHSPPLPTPLGGAHHSGEHSPAEQRLHAPGSTPVPVGDPVVPSGAP